MDANKAKQGIPSPLSMSWQMLNHPYESRTPSHIMVTWEHKHHHSECPSPPSSPLHLCILSMMHYGMEYPRSEMGSAVSALSPPSLRTPSLLVGGVV